MESVGITALAQRKRELETELAGLKSQNEIAARKGAELAEGATALVERIRDLEKQILDLDTAATDAIESAKNASRKASETFSGINTLLDDGLRLLEAITKKADDQAKRHGEFLEEEKTKREYLLEEGVKLDVRKKDVEVFKKRLQEFYTKHNLGTVIL